jgi:hypothetical protein
LTRRSGKKVTDETKVRGGESGTPGQDFIATTGCRYNDKRPNSTYTKIAQNEAVKVVLPGWGRYTVLVGPDGMHRSARMEYETLLRDDNVVTLGLLCHQMKLIASFWMPGRNSGIGREQTKFALRSDDPWPRVMRRFSGTRRCPGRDRVLRRGVTGAAASWSPADLAGLIRPPERAA